MADHPLRPATDRRLGRPLPHQLANRTSAAPIARGRFQSPAFLSPAHAVLAWLSPGYPPQQDTFRCVTHPFATRRQGCPRVTVRLACVRHAASVQSEPGSNSSVQSKNSQSSSKVPSPKDPIKDLQDLRTSKPCEHFIFRLPPRPIPSNSKLAPRLRQNSPQSTHPKCPHLSAVDF